MVQETAETGIGQRKANEAEPGPATDAERRTPMTLSEAGRRGGETTKARYGPSFYSKIGGKGGETVARLRGSEYYAEIGRKGGRARVEQSRRQAEDAE